MLNERNLPVKDSLIQISSLRDEKGGYEGATKLLSMKDRPTAIFATNDIAAIGVLKAAKDRGIKVPYDLSVVGFDNIETGAYLEVPLTSVSQPVNEMGEMATQILMKRIECEKNDINENEIKRVALRPKLVIRNTTRKINSH